MFWLLACAPPPALPLGVTPPAAIHASAVPVDTFVGPVEVAGLDHLDAAALCGAPDRAALLRDGRFGWRVLVVTPEGLALADAPGDDGLGAAELRVRLEARVARWTAADKAASERCGVAGGAAVLIVADGRARFDSGALWYGSLLDGFDVRLLVADAEPGLPVAAPATREAGFSLTLAGSPHGWLVVGSVEDVQGSTHRRAADAAQRVVTAGYPDVLFTVDPKASWSLAVEGLDALAGIGVVPATSLSVGGDLPPPVPPPSGATRLVLGERIPVLAFRVPTYIERGVGRR